jgi:hypothetical protein
LASYSESKGAYQNRGLFSDDYLEHRLTDPVRYPEWEEDITGVYEKFRELYEDKKDQLGTLNEAQTETEFLEPALGLLGFHFIPQVGTKAGEKPDYALFGSETDKNAASKHQKDFQKFFAPSLALVEGKYWSRDLNARLKGDDRDLIRYKSAPEMQIVGYLQATEVSWGILTNGAEWRLYYGDATGKTKRYYSVDLTRALETKESFRRFYLFFRREAFIRKGPESKSFLERVLGGSEDYAVRVGKELKKVIFEKLFPGLAKGFLEYHEKRLGLPVDEEALEKTYRGTLALLYRLLFLLYAEARDLLPAGDRLGYGARGINHIKLEIADWIDKDRILSSNSYGIWQDLTDLFRIVDHGDTDLNVPPYNGGLFKDEGNHEFLRTHRVSDRYMGPVLDELSRQVGDASPGEKRFVDYGFIGVRELGSVYEGLLEFSLRTADEDLAVVKEKGKELYAPKASNKKKSIGEVKAGDPYLVNDKKERKATGSYYTPGYIVDYIVENSLGPLVEERREALREKLEEIGKLERDLRRARKSEEYVAKQMREAGALDTLLDVKVLDPAMGSGHFLVAAVDYLTDEFSRVIVELEAVPVVEELAGLRAEVRESLQGYGIEVPDEQLSDANLLKRMIMKRCVYGVDLNEMAVELAKLSLWLDAFTVGAPLSFLDHHLKHGNSLIGSSVREVRRELEESMTLLGGPFVGLLSATSLMQEVGEVADITLGEVERSVSLYAEADRSLAPFKRIMDIWTSEHFGNKNARAFLSTATSSGAADQLVKGDYDSFAERDKKTIDVALDFADTKHFFHWELEFPEVFYDGARERENPGFDAVVGNPPYDVLKRDPEDPEFNRFIGFLRQAPRYEPAVSRVLNVFQFMMVQALHLASRTGAMSMIIPMSLLSDQSAKGLRRLLFEQYELDETQAFPQKDDENNRVFPEAKLSTIVLAARPDSTSEILRFRVHPGRDILPSSPVLQIRYEDIRDFDTDNLTVPLGNPAEVGILQRMFGQAAIEPFSSSAKVMVGEIDMTNDKDCKQLKPAQHELLKGAHLQRYLKRVNPKQGQREWVNLDKLKEKYGENASKLKQYRVNRLAFQGVTGTDDTRRLKASKVQRGNFLANSLNYINILSPKIDAEFILALFNSRFFEWRFRLTSTNNNVNNYEIHSLPFRRIDFTTTRQERRNAVEEATKLYEAGSYAAVARWAEQELDWTPEAGHTAEGRSDTVHDLLAHLAGTMTATHEERVETERTWREWVEALLPSNHKLTKTFLERGWIEAGLREGWPGVLAGFQAKKAVPGAKDLQKLKRETEQALSELRPLYERIRSTDELIDQIVYRLYGLTEEEISVVESGGKQAEPSA